MKIIAKKVLNHGYTQNTVKNIRRFLFFNNPCSNWEMTSSTANQESEEELRKMEKLAETYFDEADLQSEIYFPVSALKTSQFYPGATLSTTPL